MQACPVERLERLLRPLALGDVLFDGNEVADRPALIMNRSDHLLLSVQAPILPAIDDLTVPRLAGKDRLPQISVKRLIVLARPEKAGVLASGLLRRVAG